MTFSLDTLLDATGIDQMTGEQLNKTASPGDGQALSKLAERCRRAVEATPDERSSDDERQLVEKTAAVAIIGRTLAEIRAIDIPPEQVKTASAEDPDAATFIKAALEAGHDPRDIAEFLEKKAGLVSRGVRRVKEWGAGRQLDRASKADVAAGKGMGKASRRWEELVRSLDDAPEAQRAAMLSRMRVKMGPQSAYNVINRAGGKGWKDMAAYKGLKKSLPPGTGPGGAPGAKKPAVGVSVGGKEVGLSSSQLSKVKKPALYAGAGMMAHRAITGPKDDNKRRRGAPIIINS